MTIKGNSIWKSKVFDTERAYYNHRDEEIRSGLANSVRTDEGWILFGPQDVRDNRRNYHFALQRLKVDGQLRVRVGCRYYTIEQAFKHWDPKRACTSSRRNEMRQARTIIVLMVLQAQAFGLLSMYDKKVPQFDIKPKRRTRRA